MYADKVTASMQRTIDETSYRRSKQMDFNIKHGLTPKALNKKIDTSLTNQFKSYNQDEPEYQNVAEEISAYINKNDIEKAIKEKRKEMEKAAKNLDFLQAAKLRDE